MRYFIYCRKSSEAEDRQVMSIESQLSTLQRAFTDKTGIEFVAIYEEAFSAKSPGRPRFNEMLQRIENGEAEGIVSWAPDRLARNSIDGGRIVYLLDRGVLKDLKFATYTFENNSQGKFMLQIMFGQSKYYSDALSENVKRGNRTKVEKGWRPNQPPLGYLNDPVSRTIVPDLERLPLVRRLFDFMLTGSYSVRRICQIARDELGLRTPQRRRSGGKPLALSGVYKLLNNPFYAGILVWAGKSYQGAHQAIISLNELDRIKAILRRPEKPRPHRRTFPFTGMIRCGECGLLVTAEEKTNRYGSHYTYYHCTKRKPTYHCQQRSVTAEELELQIVAFLSHLSIPKGIHDWAITQLKLSNDEQKTIEVARRRSVQTALADIERASQNLTSLRIRDLIEDAEFLTERRKLEDGQLRLRQELDRNAPETFEPAQAMLSFSNRAVDWFRAGDQETKRLIFELTGSNPRLKGKKLFVEAKKPFRLIPKSRSPLHQRALVKNIRTLLCQNDKELLHILDGIKQLETKRGIPLVEEARRVA